MFRTQSPTDIKDLLVSQERDTMEAIKGRRQNWKQEANLLHAEERRDRMEEAPGHPQLPRPLMTWPVRKEGRGQGTE